MQLATRLATVSLLALGALACHDKAKPSAASADGVKPVVEIVTNKGSVKVELWPDKAPATVANFLSYVDAKHYDGTVFHRVIRDFMIQGGGFTTEMQEKDTRSPVKNEAANGLKNVAGTIAMARTSVPDSATAQFFINVKDNAFLDFKDPSPRGIGYCVFGKVTSGYEVVKEIELVPTGVDSKSGMPDVPTTPVVIQTIRRAN